MIYFRILPVLILFTFGVTACQVESEKIVAPPAPIDLVKEEFPAAKAEIQAVLDGIFLSIQQQDADKLISYHAYGPKFTEFKEATYRNGSEGNEAYERGFVGMISSFDYDLEDLKIVVYGEVAVVTFHANFRPTVEENQLQINEQTTLIFVDTDKGWKIVHEHHSELARQ